MSFLEIWNWNEWILVIQFYGSLELRTIKLWGMALMSGHINMKQRLERGLNSWDKASRDEKPRGTGGIQLGRQQEQPLGF